MEKLLAKLGFDQQTFMRFLIIALGSQTIFSFIAIRSVLYNPFLEALNVTNTEFGVLMSMTGIGVLVAWALGYVQNRYPRKNILTGGLLLNAACILAVTTSPSYPVLLVIFGIMGFQVMGLYFPTVLNSIASLASAKKQGTAFGTLELIRRILELLQNALAVAIFTMLGGGLLGIKTSMFVSAAMIIAVALLTHFYLPEEPVLDCDEKDKSKEALKNLKIALKMPEPYLVGLTASGIYAAYVGLQYFLPFLNDVFALPVVAGAVFGLINTSFTGMIASPVSGLLADNVFKSPTRYLNILLTVLVLGLFVILALPRGEGMLWPTMCVLIGLAFLMYLGRGVYYAPIGEMGLPKEIQGGAMSIAAFLGYSPMFFAYALYGYQIDNYESIEAYNRIFMIMIGCSSVGMISSLILWKRRKNRKEDTALEAQTA